MAKGLEEAIEKFLKEAGELRLFDIRTRGDADLEVARARVIDEKIMSLNNRYRLALQGTPEGSYLDQLYQLYLSGRTYDKKTLDVQITSLNGLSVRANDILYKSGILYVGELVTKTPTALLSLQGFGRKSLKEVLVTLEGMDLALEMKLTEPYKRPE